MKKHTKRTSKRKNTELESTYFLKLVMYFIFGSLWLHIAVGTYLLPIPVGFVVGAAYVRHEHFSIDRKIELAVLLTSTLLFYFLSPRLIISF